MGAIAICSKCCVPVPEEIQNLNLPPTTPTTVIFDKLCDYLGVDIDSVEPYLNTLREQWYYRAIDLLSVTDDMWTKMQMPVPLATEISNYMQHCRENEAFISFKEPIPAQKHIKYVLNPLKEENQLESTSKHITDLYAMLQQNYLLNICKFRVYMDEQRWNDLDIPTQLKVILLQKINCTKFDHDANQLEPRQIDREGDVMMNEVEGVRNNPFPAYPAIQKQSEPQEQMSENDPLNDEHMKENMGACEYKVDPFDTMNEIINMLSDELFIEKEHVIHHFTPFLQYKYKRIYQLSTISKELYDALLDDSPDCLKMELHGIMQYIQHNHKLMPFYNPKKKKTSTSFLDVDWTMTTDQLFAILEHDLNLTAGELSQDVDILMNNFYSNLWDLFFVTDRCWQSMPYYSKYEIVRKRIHDLLKQCQEKYNLNPKMLNPKVPTPWANQYNGMESVEFILFNSGKKKDKFSLYGTDWSQYTEKGVKLINEYLTKNMVKKIQFLPNEHSKNNAQWTQYMTEHDIPSHLRFKLNFYAIKGEIQTEDQWLHDYVGNHYMNEPPQLPQERMDEEVHLNGSFSLLDHSGTVSPPKFRIVHIKCDGATVEFTAIRKELDCCIERKETEQKVSEWNAIETVSNQTSYVLQDLNPDTKYKIRVKYNVFAKYSKAISFKTNGLFSSSTILNVETHIKMMQLLETNVRSTKATLLYRASRDGKGSQIFKDKCYNKSNILCIIHSTSNCIFGGYATKGVIETQEAEYRKDEKAFIFSVQSVNNTEANVFKVTQPDNAMYCSKNDSIRFGYIFGLYSNGQSGWSIQQPSYYERYPSNYYLTAGYSSFTVQDVEVFQLN